MGLVGELVVLCLVGELVDLRTTCLAFEGAAINNTKSATATTANLTRAAMMEEDMVELENVWLTLYAGLAR